LIKAVSTVDKRLNRREDDHWTFKKEVNITHIFTTLTILATALIWATSVEVRFTEQRKGMEYNKDVANNILKHLESMDERLGKMISEFQYVRGKLDGNGKDK